MESCGGEEERGGCSPLLDGDDVASSRTRRRGRATSAQTLGNVLVSLLGTGALALPYAFKVAGWLAASLALVTAAVSTCYCMLLLVESRKKLEEDAEEADMESQTQTFADVGAHAFGVVGRFLTEFLVLVSYVGGAMAYLLFMGQNLSSVYSSLSAKSSIPSSAFIFLLLLPLEISLSFIRSLSFLAPFSTFATFCNVFAMAVVIKEDMNRLEDFSFDTGSAFNGLWSMPFVLGVAVFCFDGVGMTLVLEESMSKRKTFPLVLVQAFIGIILLYICFGAFGYLAYGEETEEIITLNLPNNWSAVSVKLGLSIAIAFTFPVAVHPIHEIIERKLNSSGWFRKLCHNSQAKDWLTSQIARILVMVALALLATSAPGFAQLMSLTGSTVCALLAFVLPASFHLKIMGSSLKLWRRMVDYFILLVGFTLASYGTYDAISGCFMC